MRRGFGFIVKHIYLGPYMRKSISLLILLAMLVHAAGRFGALSYVYENRHAIAFSFGLIGEVPIAMCSSEYDFGDQLMVDQSSSDESMPAFMHAQEIKLFCVPVLNLPETGRTILEIEPPINAGPFYNPVSRSSVFHPPLV